MDKTLPETTMLDTALGTLRLLGLEVDIIGQEIQLGRARADAQIRLRFGGQEVRYAVQTRRGLRQDMLDDLQRALDPLGEEALLVADYLAPDLAHALKRRHIAFLDTAGNAYLERPPLLIWIEGKLPVRNLVAEALPAPWQVRKAAPPATAAGRAFQARGLRVLFALLCHPEWVGEPYRQLATRADVAHGTVGWAMADLMQQGFVDEVGGKRRLLQRDRLLQQWVEAYLRVLRPKQLLARFRADQPFDWATLDLPKYGLLLGGEAAAARLTDYLRPEIITLYGERAEPRLILDYGLRPDPAGNIEIRSRFWNFAGDTPDLVPLPLVYADLLASGDARCLEAAQLLSERLRA
jgi:hypothetical protein